MAGGYQASCSVETVRLFPAAFTKTTSRLSAAALAGDPRTGAPQRRPGTDPQRHDQLLGKHAPLLQRRRPGKPCCTNMFAGTPLRAHSPPGVSEPQSITIDDVRHFYNHYSYSDCVIGLGGLRRRALDSLDEGPGKSSAFRYCPPGDNRSQPIRWFAGHDRGKGRAARRSASARGWICSAAADWYPLPWPTPGRRASYSAATCTGHSAELRD